MISARYQPILVKEVISKLNNISAYYIFARSLAVRLVTTNAFTYEMLLSAIPVGELLEATVGDIEGEAVGELLGAAVGDFDGETGDASNSK